MILAGATRICFTISPGKSDIVEYYGGGIGPAHICYVVQPEPQGLCDALFRALPLIGADDQVLIGLPDTVWFPEDGLCRARRGRALLPPLPRPQPRALRRRGDRRRRPGAEIQVKQTGRGQLLGLGGVPHARPGVP